MFKIHRTFDLSTGVKNNSIAVISDAASTIVIYHNTRVFVATKKCITLYNGGWDTISTRTVINNALSKIGHADGVFLERIKGVTMINIRGKRQVFESGFKLVAKDFSKAVA